MNYEEQCKCGAHCEEAPCYDCLKKENKRLREAMREFVLRCEEGSIRSKYTYGLFKTLLESKGGC